jgi:hypothetical protein
MVCASAVGSAGAAGTIWIVSALAQRTAVDAEIMSILMIRINYISCILYVWSRYERLRNEGAGAADDEVWRRAMISKSRLRATRIYIFRSSFYLFLNVVKVLRKVENLSKLDRANENIIRFIFYTKRTPYCTE